jgi:hypothetical protein
MVLDVLISRAYSNIIGFPLEGALAFAGLLQPGLVKP